MRHRNTMIFLAAAALSWAGGGLAAADERYVLQYDEPAKTIDEAAFVAYQRDPETSNHLLPVVPDEALAEAPYILHLLPALPSAWPNGSISGLRARGGFEVDIEWDSGQLVQATIRANTDGSFRIDDQGKLSEVISLNKGQSKVWPGTNECILNPRPLAVRP